jgi:activator of HSP90 ATPase
MNFKGQNLAQLIETHSEMQATAKDLGLELGAEFAGGFTTETDGVNICEALHAKIEAYRAGLDTELTVIEGTGLASGEETAHKPKKTRAKAAAKKSKATETENNGNAAESAKESQVAKATKAATTGGKKAAKKSAAKKAVKKVTKKAVAKKAKVGVASDGSVLNDACKYAIVAKENPYRADTIRAKMFDKLKKASDVAGLKKAGGETWALRIAIRDGHAKLVK